MGKACKQEPRVVSSIPSFCRGKPLGSLLLIFTRIWTSFTAELP